MTKHTHTPTRRTFPPLWRFRCEHCGKDLVWIYPLPNRAGHWRAA